MSFFGRVIFRYGTSPKNDLMWKKMTLTQIWYHMIALVVEIRICQSVVKLKKPTLEMIEPNKGRVRNFTPGIICSADHSAQKKKLGGETMKTILLRKIKKTLHRSVGCVSLCAFHEKNAYLEIYFLLHRYLNPGNSCQILILTTRDLNAGLIKKNIRDC